MAVFCWKWVSFKVCGQVAGQGEGIKISVLETHSTSKLPLLSGLLTPVFCHT